MYRAVTSVVCDSRTCDQYATPFGIRSFTFDREKGFFLNGQHVKIRGVCLHHDLGALGAAFNTRAMERQIELMKAMGANAIRTSHNPPAPEFLDLADRMGIIVMDEAFDMWKMEKTRFDYHLDWDEWHVRDLSDMVLRDRNHPSVFIWSIGNEVMEQWTDTVKSAAPIAMELAGIVRRLDPTRPITNASANGNATKCPSARGRDQSSKYIRAVAKSAPLEKRSVNKSDIEPMYRCTTTARGSNHGTCPRDAAAQLN